MAGHMFHFDIKDSILLIFEAHFFSIIHTHKHTYTNFFKLWNFILSVVLC